MEDFASRFKHQVRSNFDMSGQDYLHLEQKHDFYGKLTDALANYVSETGLMASGWESRNWNILDVGCGIGNSTRRLKARFPQARLTGLDLSPKMLETANKESSGIEFVCGDGENLVDYFSPGSFDLIFYPASLFLLPNQEQSLTQARQLLKDGGIIAASIIQGIKEKNNREVQSLSGIPGILKNDKLLLLLEKLFSRRFSAPVQIPIDRGIIKAIYAVPALLAGLFPKLPPQERSLKVDEFIKEIEEKKLELMQEWLLVVAQK